MRARSFRLGKRQSKHEGQTLVEFALVSLIFLMITMGTIDVGRAIFMYEQLHNAVRDAARVVKVYPGNGQGALTLARVQNDVYNYRSTDPALLNAYRARPGMSSAVVSFSCSAGCQPATGTITVTASLQFGFFLATFLHLPVPAVTLTASATDSME